MNKFSRRNFLLTAIGAATGQFVCPGPADAKEHGKGDQAGLVAGQAKPLRYKSIPGFFSEEQIFLHHTAHYGGALRGYVTADLKLHSAIIDGTGVDSNAYDAIQRARTNKANSVILHELYFDGMIAKVSNPSEVIHAAIKKRFGSIEKWAFDFQESAKSAKGWASLVFHPVNRKLYNVVSDNHASGVLWMATPLVVIDVYEHAFYIDYKNKKALYIEKFMQHIDWEEVNRRYKSISL